MRLVQKKCVPCEGGVPKLKPEEIRKFLQEIPNWSEKDEKLYRSFSFKNFKETMKFVNQMAELAEQEGHHPDFTVHYNQVEVVIWTHAIGGLSENDFILAAKIDHFSS